MNIKLTVYFDAPFWVGVFERTDNGLLETSRIVFGSEPKDYEVYSHVLKSFSLLDFSRPIKDEDKTGKRISPKRLQRIIRREVQDTGIGTKAQQALKLEQEARKMEHRKLSRQKREELEQVKFEKRREKRKEKKKGH